MRLSIHGATGRIGTKLVSLILETPQLDLAGALVSPDSPRLGQPVGGGGLVYRPADTAIRARADVMIDFSTPEASLRLQDMLADSRMPIVIGTTGFTDAEKARLAGWARYRPMLISENFAVGFESFAAAVARIARDESQATGSVEEVYHARKKRSPSGTSRRLAQSIAEQAPPVERYGVKDVPIAISRRGETVGVNRVRFDLGSTEIEICFSVHSLVAYAEGALAAARWLTEARREPGFYTSQDMQQQ